jgi:hypothetical protein
MLAAMQIARTAFVALALALAAGACGGGSGNSQIDASGPACTRAVYDPCTSNDQCASQDCHLYNGAGLQVCTQVCNATTPCPNDAAGNAVACNMMGSCRPSVANNCHR